MSQVQTRYLRVRYLSLRFNLLATSLLLLTALGCQNQNPTSPVHQIAKDPLPSWSDTSPKKNIIAFVDRVTKEGSPDFVPVADRIATFDNDGTLWVEAPMYTQFLFSFDRVKQMAPQHPEWKTKQPFKGVLDGDMKAVMATGEKGINQIIVATSTGMTSPEFEKTVSDWITQAHDRKFNRTYTELIYQPMIELLAYLRANNFKTFIVSGGEVGFMRPWTEKSYGIPPEQVVGTTMKTELQTQNGAPVIMRLPQISFIDDGPGKPVGIDTFIGKRPLAAFGNSDGDQQMLEWTAAGPGPRFMLLVHHTDADREYAYDRTSAVGKLDKALDEANTKGWTVVSMKDDWKKIFAFQ
ncbi:MAG TPA: HAD family hydrolase [Edaphobacter sp.]|jgi:phosphoglycolate phosphatase-like HAD superfamily hydrolase|nr:HAD family hydrolase [Edaphobacter sp.]